VGFTKKSSKKLAKKMAKGLKRCYLNEKNTQVGFVLAAAAILVTVLMTKERALVWYGFKRFCESKHPVSFS
jgi:hypothetical protein